MTPEKEMTEDDLGIRTDDPRVREFATVLIQTYQNGPKSGQTDQERREIIGDFISTVGETARPATAGPQRKLRKASAEEFGLFAHKHDLPLVELADDPDYGFVQGGIGFSGRHHLALICVAGPADAALETKNDVIYGFKAGTARHSP